MQEVTNNTNPPQVYQPEPNSASSYQPQRDGKWKKIVILLVAVFLVILIVVGLIYFVSSRKSPGDQRSDIVVPVPDPLPDDKDRDGISNERERELGLNELEFDTDGDGLTDLEEIEDWKTDPLNPDTDDDGFYDGYEILKGYNPNGEGELN